MALAPFEHGGNLYEAAAAAGRPIHDFLDFSANINPLGLAPSVEQAIITNLPTIIHYPDAGASTLKQAISEHYHVPAGQIIPGNGAVELLYLLCHIVRPKHVLIPAPTFSEYERAARSVGAEIRYFYLPASTDFSLDPVVLLQHITANSIVFIGNPNNPTGKLIKRAEIVPLIRQAAAVNSIVVVDESFIDFLPDSTDYTCRCLVSKYDNLVVLHSLTKFYAIPGLRLGFALASDGLCAKMHSAKDPWNVNSLAQAAGVAALADTAFQQQSRAAVGAAKKQLYDRLRDIRGLCPYEPAVNFIFVNIGATGLTAAQLRSRMMEYKILIRDCSNYPGLADHFIRVAVKSEQANDYLIAACKKILEVL